MPFALISKDRIKLCVKSHGNPRMKKFYNKSTPTGELEGTKFCTHPERSNPSGGPWTQEEICQGLRLQLTREDTETAQLGKALGSQA